MRLLFSADATFNCIEQDHRLSWKEMLVVVMPKNIPNCLAQCLAFMIEKDAEERLSAEAALTSILRAFPKFLTTERIQTIQQIQLEMDDVFFKDVEKLGFKEADRQRLAQFLENHGEKFKEMGYSQDIVE